MIPFPKRPRAKSIDLEDEDIVELASSVPSQPVRPKLPSFDDLADTSILPPKGTPGSIAPVALAPREEDTHRIARSARDKDRTPVVVSGRPSLPWAAALVLAGSLGTALGLRLLDAVDTHHGVAAAADLSAPQLVAAPLAPPAPAKPSPVVLHFEPSEAVTVALAPPAPPAPPPTLLAAIAPPPVAVAAPQAPIAVKKPVVAASSSPPPADSIKRATSLDSLAEAQLKAALK